MTIESALGEAVARVIDKRRHQGKISPSWVATEAMREIDPDRVSLDVVYGGCHLQCRQIARDQLRKRYEPGDSRHNSDQHELWPDLQGRYPTARSAKDEEPEYVLLELMTEEDIGFNVARLRSEAVAKMRHADALEAFGQSRPGKAA